jgi:hypothetical protein
MPLLRCVTCHYYRRARRRTPQLLFDLALGPAPQSIARPCSARLLLRRLFDARCLLTLSLGRKFPARQAACSATGKVENPAAPDVDRIGSREV